MELTKKFTDENISRILDQALVYQCACPAQVCKKVIGLRELFDFQQQCLCNTETDKKVHTSIADSTVTSHAEMEDCLQSVL